MDRGFPHRLVGMRAQRTPLFGGYGAVEKIECAVPFPGRASSGVAGGVFSARQLTFQGPAPFRGEALRLEYLLCVAGGGRAPQGECAVASKMLRSWRYRYDASDAGGSMSMYSTDTFKRRGGFAQRFLRSTKWVAA